MTVSPKRKKPVYAGLSITRHAAELVVFSAKNMAVTQAASIPMPPGVFDTDADIIENPAALKEVLSQLIRSVRPKPGTVHLSLPGSLMRMVEMPRMEPEGLYVSLSSEAERYKTFDNTEAIVDFAFTQEENTSSKQQLLVFGAVRNDTLSVYLKILKDLRLKVVSISLEPVNVLRAMAGTGVLDGMVQQIGADAHWGAIFVEPTRVRLSLWQCDRLVELRETAMETQEFAVAGPDSIVVEDLLEEIRRTTKTFQPSIWLTHDLPPQMAQNLESRLNVPFRAAPIGDSLALPQPLQLATVGVAMSSLVAFPFDLDLTAGLGKAGGASFSTSAVEVQGESGGADWMIPAGIAAIVIGGLATAALFGAATMTGQKIPGLEAQRNTNQAEVSMLTARQRELQKQVELDQALIEVVGKARAKNKVYVSLTEDLKAKTPERIWIHALKVNSGLEMEGKALNHQSVINFARSFDQIPYAQSVQISAIKEDRLNGALVYDFKIGGQVNLRPAPPAPTSAESTPDTGTALPSDTKADAANPGA